MRRYLVGLVAIATIATVPASASATKASSSRATYSHCTGAKGQVVKCKNYYARGPLGPKGATGTPGSTGAQGVQGLPGIPGVAGPVGLEGSQGLQGLIGLTGANGNDGIDGAEGKEGAQGPPGAEGKTGAEGPSGPAGPEGAASTVAGPVGPTGAEGPAGPAGPAGASSPLIYGPYTSTNDPDTGECSSEWAKDTYLRTYIVTPQPDGSFDVTVLVNGSFTTIEGAEQPGATPCGPTITSSSTGTFYGDYVVAIPVGAEFDPEATFSSAEPSLSKTTEEFVETIFPGQKLGNYAWQFHYRLGGESWDNTDHGNTGNITG